MWRPVKIQTRKQGFLIFLQENVRHIHRQCREVTYKQHSILVSIDVYAIPNSLSCGNEKCSLQTYRCGMVAQRGLGFYETL